MVVDHRHRVALAQAEALRARAVERRDRRNAVQVAHVRERERQVAVHAANRLRREAELELDVVRVSVAIVVDVELVEDVRVEVPVVRPCARLLARDDVHDHRDLVRVAGLVAPEHEEVRDVRRRIERDERSLAVACRLSRLRPCQECGERKGTYRQAEDQGDELLSIHGFGHCRLSPH